MSRKLTNLFRLSAAPKATELLNIVLMSNGCLMKGHDFLYTSQQRLLLMLMLISFQKKKFKKLQSSTKNKFSAHMSKLLKVWII